MVGIWEEELCSSQMTDRVGFLTSPHSGLRERGWSQVTRYCHLRILFTYYQSFMTATQRCGVSGMSEEDAYKPTPIETVA